MIVSVKTETTGATRDDFINISMNRIQMSVNNPAAGKFLFILFRLEFG